MAAGSTSSDTLSLISCGPCSQVLKATQLNTPKLFTGTYWYLTQNYSFGFSPNANITQSRHDQYDSNDALRLSWVIDSGAGVRLGKSGLISSSAYSKYIFIR